MVEATRELIRERGVNATAMSDVLERSGAPRGSTYFHFPGGKTELIVEAAESHASAQVELIERLAAGATSAEDLITRYVDAAREGMIASEFSRGCGIAPLVLEGPDDSERATAAREGFLAMTERMASAFAAFGLGEETSRMLADATIAAVEGALVTSRALRSPTPFEAVSASLVALAEKS
jgi:AcrR family transcriptional regulator